MIIYIGNYGWDFSARHGFGVTRYAALYSVIAANAIQSIGCFIIFLLMQPRAYDNLRLLFGLIDRIPEPTVQSDGSFQAPHSNTLLAIDLTDDDILMDRVMGSFDHRNSELVSSPVFESKLNANLL